MSSYKENASSHSPLAKLIFDDRIYKGGDENDPVQLIVNSQAYEVGNIGYNLLERLAESYPYYVDEELLWEEAFGDEELNPVELRRALVILDWELKQASRTTQNFIASDPKDPESFRLLGHKPIWTTQTRLPNWSPGIRVHIFEKDPLIYLNISIFFIHEFVT
jgi:hypothetical protein